MNTEKIVVERVAGGPFGLWWVPATFVSLAVLLALTLPLVSLAQSSEDVPVTQNDSDGDGIVDTADIDDDGDGIPDVREISPDGSDRDTDGDGRPDRLDLDADNDGILDWIEANATAVIDISGLRVVSGRLVGEVGDNGLLDIFEEPDDTGVLAYAIADTDRRSDGHSDGLPDFMDLDSDNDGWPDLIEAGVAPALDGNADGRLDVEEGGVGNDGIVDRVQRSNDASCCDVTGDGIDDDIPRDSDGQGTPDYVDIDSDDDGIRDLVELGGIDDDDDGRIDNFVDVLADGLDDGVALVPLVATDSNGNGLADPIDRFAPDASGGRPRPATLPADDGSLPGGVRTAYGSAGCSVASRASDGLLIFCALVSLAAIGRRHSLRGKS